MSNFQAPAEFTKRHGPSVASDWKRVIRLYQASGSSAGFFAPRPLKLAAESQSIVYAALPRGRVLSQFLTDAGFRNSGWLEDRLHATGAALAHLHARMEPSNAVMLSTSMERLNIPARCVEHVQSALELGGTAACHGDFGHGNVWIAEDGRIWLYDPIPGPFSLEKDASQSSIYFDIGQMGASLWAVYPLVHYPRLEAFPRLAWIDAFLAGYRSVGKPIDSGVAFLFAAENLERYGRHLAARSLFTKAVWRLLIETKRKQMLKSAVQRLNHGELSR